MLLNYLRNMEDWDGQDIIEFIRYTSNYLKFEMPIIQELFRKASYEKDKRGRNLFIIIME